MSKKCLIGIILSQRKNIRANSCLSFYTFFLVESTFQYQMTCRAITVLTKLLQMKVRMSTWSPVSWMLVKILATAPTLSRKLVMADSCPVWPFLKFVTIWMNFPAHYLI